MFARYSKITRTSMLSRAYIARSLFVRVIKKTTKAPPFAYTNREIFSKFINILKILEKPLFANTIVVRLACLRALQHLNSCNAKWI